MEINLFFDCDGVILNSNKLKTKLFKKLLLSYGLNNVSKFITYHQNNGGISRIEKLDYFFKKILKRKPRKDEIDNLLNDFSESLINHDYEKLVTNNLIEFKKLFKSCNFFIISGSNQIELRYIFQKLSINNIFNGGIYGNPRDKITIFKDLKVNNKNLNIFFGDSIYDFNVSKYFNIKFFFIYQWTEVKDWFNFCNDNNIEYFKEISESKLLLKKFINEYKKKTYSSHPSF